MLASSAARALSTAELAVEQLGIAGSQIVADRMLYNTYADELIDYIRQLDDSLDSVMVVGHNPTMFTASNLLGNQRLSHLGTGSGVLFEFDAECWREIGPEKCSQMRELVNK